MGGRSGMQVVWGGKGLFYDCVHFLKVLISVEKE